jgi:adenylate cyclase
MLSRLGVRGRLLLAFFGISAFGVLGAGAAFYSFREIDNTLDLITQRRMPVALMSQELSRHTERIVAAAPALLAATTQDEKVERFIAILSEANVLIALLANLRYAGVESRELAALEPYVERLRDNLNELNLLVNNRLVIAEQKRNVAHNSLAVVNAMHQLLGPWVAVMDGKIAQWRQAAVDQSVPIERRNQLDRELEESLAWFRSLQQSQVQVSYVNDLLQRAASTDEGATLGIISFRLQQTLNEMERLASELDPKLRSLMVESIARLRPFVIGDDGIPALRRREIEMVANGTRLLGENAVLSKSLTETVDRLVQDARRDITGANAEALSFVRLSTWILVATVVLSLMSSILIVWLYVGRNLIARLRALTNRVLTLAAGDLNSPLPPVGSDEIGRMAESLAVFRATAIEMEEANLKEIREARTRLTDAIEAISEGFSLYDAEDKLVVCNSRYKELFPFHSDVMLPGTRFETIVRTALDRGLIVDAEGEPEAWLKERVARHRSPRGTHVQHRNDGRWIRINERITSNGGVVATYADITELKQREEQLEKAMQQAETANRSKSAFLANMSHELRTPLNAIIGYSEILQEDVADYGHDQLTPDLEKIEDAGRHLLGLINDILDLSKIEAGRMDLFLEEVEIVPLLDEVRAIIVPLAEKNRNTLELQLSTNLGSIRTDRTKLKQCLLNVLSNGSKFTENGRLTLTAERFGSDHPTVRFIICDTGIGMTEEQLDRLFQAFSQADASTTKKYGGTGLGLAITRYFCQLLGGDIEVASRPGEGSTFTITLPERAPVAARIEPDEVPRIAGEAESSTTVLVVDDDPAARDLLTVHLKAAGYRLVHAASGEEALDLARTLRPDAITLDVLMPKTDGWAVLSALKADVELRDIPVVVVTVLPDRGIGLSLGAVDVLTKPVDRAHLAALLHRLLRRDGPVLLVEDDAGTREIIRNAIEKMHLTTAEAVNGRSALHWLADNPAPAVILLDLMMPEMDGFEFLDAFSERAEWRDIPVIVITAKQLTPAERERLLGQAQKVIAKSASIRADIAAAVGEAVRRRPAHATVGASA